MINLMIKLSKLNFKFTLQNFEINNFFVVFLLILFLKLIFSYLQQIIR